MSHHLSPAQRRLYEGRGMLQTHRPAFWLMVIVLLIGGGMAIPSMATTIAGNPVSAGISLILVAVFGAAVFMVISVLDYLDPQPVSVLAVSFILGALVTTTFTQLVSVPINHLFANLISSEALAGAFSAATSEETYKALVVVLVFLTTPWWWNRVMDGLVAGAVVGLGFQLWEDVTYMVTGSGDATPDVPQMLTIFFDRVVLHGIAAHAAYTAIFGAALAYAMTRKMSPAARAGVIGAGYAVAWLAHVFWDAPFLGSLTSSQGGLIVYTIIKALPIIGVIVFLGRSAYRRLRADFIGSASPVVVSGDLDDDEVAALSSLSGRRAERKQASTDGGHAAAENVAHLQRARVDLVRLHMHGVADDETVEAQAAAIAGS